MENTSNERKNAPNDAQHELPKDVPLPDPTLVQLVSGLASQAMISMGLFPHPINGQSAILPNQARHLIETIALLDEKTKGNQTEEETKTISNVLHELRMLFVAAQNEKQRRETESDDS